MSNSLIRAKNLSRFVPAVLLGLVVSLPSYGLEFPKTGGRGAPTRSTGGGTRGEQCLVNRRGSLLLNALMPQNERITLTASHPDIPTALFFYIPQVLGEKEAELLIGSDQGDEIYRQTVALPDTPGILRVEIPQQDEAGTALLQTDTDYAWEFSVICDPDDRDRDRVVQGSLRRVMPSAELAIALAATSDPLRQAELYASEGIWQEALTLAAQLSQDNAEPWQELLASVGLGEIANEPFVGGWEDDNHGK